MKASKDQCLPELYTAVRTSPYVVQVTIYIELEVIDGPSKYIYTTFIPLVKVMHISTNEYLKIGDKKSNN